MVLSFAQGPRRGLADLGEFIIETDVKSPRRGQPHSAAFRQCVSQRYSECADNFGIRELTRCLVSGTKTSTECKEIFDKYNDCLSEAFKSCIAEFIW
jgi:hypothetical protein